MHAQFYLYIHYGRKFIRRIGGFTSNLPINFRVWYHQYCTIIAFTSTRPAARCASLIVGIEFTIDSCIRGLLVSKEFLAKEVGEELAFQHKKGNPNSIYAVGVRQMWRKQYSFQSHSIITLVPTEPKLAHGSLNSQCHFSINIMLANTCSTTKVNYAKGHNFSNPPNFPAIRYVLHTWAKDNGHIQFLDASEAFMLAAKALKY